MGDQTAQESRELVELSRAQCLALLAAGDFGRVAVCPTRSEVPIVRPVNYRFDPVSQSVVFRTLQGTKLFALTRRARACLEIDGHDPDARTGWSVVVLGGVEAVTQPAEVTRLGRLGVSTWPDEGQARWMRIRAQTVTGRRLASVADTPSAGQPSSPSSRA